MRSTRMTRTMTPIERRCRPRAASEKDTPVLPLAVAADDCDEHCDWL